VKPAWHLYTVRAQDREGLQAHLRAKGVATAIHYPRPVHLQPALADAGGRPGDLPVSEAVCREVLSLPLYAELPMAAVERVAAEVRAFCTAAVVK
jgi:dTDP-4-amino-4,6-dideoxygalactose transaminase